MSAIDNEMSDLEGRLVNIRKLVALDITLHGPWFILAEFGVRTHVIITVGLFADFEQFHLLIWSLHIFDRNKLLTSPSFCNDHRRNRIAEKEISYGLSHDKHYNRKYSVQQLIIILPLPVLLIAITQGIKKHSNTFF